MTTLYSRSARAFTLIELLTVIAIIGILAAIIIPTVGKVRSSARNAQCVANLREWHRAVLLYTQDNKGNYVATNWASTASGPYMPYMGKGASYLRARACPMLSEQQILSGTLTYSMSRGYQNSNPNSLINPGTIPLRRIPEPSRFLLMIDARSNSNTLVNASEGSITDVVGPLFNRADTSDINRRHGSGSVNGVFADGSLRRITGTPAGQGDPNSIYENRLAWFRMN